MTDKLMDCPDCDGEGVFESGGVEIRCCHCNETGTVPHANKHKLRCFFGLHKWNYSLSRKFGYKRTCENCLEEEYSDEFGDI